jgi:hypothetical protein
LSGAPEDGDSRAVIDVTEINSVHLNEFIVRQKTLSSRTIALHFSDEYTLQTNSYTGCKRKIKKTDRIAWLEWVARRAETSSNTEAKA